MAVTPDAAHMGGVPRPGRTAWLWTVAIALVAVGVLYGVVPAAAGLEGTWRRLREGEPLWLLAALGLEIASFGSYVAVLRCTTARGGAPLAWSRAYAITVGGVVATRMLAAAGAGGIVFTAWALRREGRSTTQAAREVSSLLVALYGVFMAALLVAAGGLALGLLPGRSPTGLTVIPALFATTVIAAALGLGRVSTWLERRRSRAAAALGVVGSGVRDVVDMLRRRERGLLGALGWWTFDVAVLWACFRAFGFAPPAAVLVAGYFIGMLANVLPVPGGIGAVDGGLVGAFIAFGLPAAGVLVVVLSYRAFAYWLPIVPGVFAYRQLRSRR